MLSTLRLLRVPGVFTALADVLAGYFVIRLVGMGLDVPGVLPYLLIASACFYMAGMAWNDIFDLAEDCRLRPERPLPAGKISMTTAVLLASLLSLAGLMLIMRAGVASFFVGAALLLLILIYNAFAKHLEGVGPLVMGGCRGLNFILGMTAHPYLFLLLQDSLLLLPAILVTLYVAIITVLATLESPIQTSLTAAIPVRDRAVDMPTDLESISDSFPTSPLHTLPPEARAHAGDQSREKGWNIVLSQNAILPKDARRLTVDADSSSDPLEMTGVLRIVLAFSLIGLLLSPWIFAWVLPRNLLSLSVFALLFLLLLPAALRTWKNPCPTSIRRTVGSGLMGLCLYNAALVASYSLAPFSEYTLAATGLIAALLIPGWILRRWITLA